MAAESRPVSVPETRNLPPFAPLRAFEAVFRCGGIRKAAATLGLSHAVVSRHIKLLENWLGEPLVQRSGNRLSLTEAGIVFHARISAALAEIDLATEEFKGSRRADVLKLCCIPGLSIQWLSKQLAAFECDYPGISIELKPTDTAPNLNLYEADADIRYYRDDAPSPSIGRGMKAIDLARPEIMPVASPEVARRLNNQMSAQCLLHEKLLHEEDQWEWRTWLEQNGVAAPTALPGPLCWHAHLAIAAARAGRGVALASHFLVNSDLISGDLVEVTIPGTRRIVLGGYKFVAREDRWSLPALSAMRRFLASKARHVDALATSDKENAKLSAADQAPTWQERKAASFRI